MKTYIPKIGFGQDSHRFTDTSTTGCIIGGVWFDKAPALLADSDGDVVYHAICNALTAITHIPIMGKVAIAMCHEECITDSRYYLEEARKTLLPTQIIQHIALSIEGQQPRMQSSIDQMRENVSQILNIKNAQVGITCTSGDGLTEFGKGRGLQCLATVTVVEAVEE